MPQIVNKSQVERFSVKLDHIQTLDSFFLFLTSQREQNTTLFPHISYKCVWDVLIKGRRMLRIRTGDFCWARQSVPNQLSLPWLEPRWFIRVMGAMELAAGSRCKSQPSDAKDYSINILLLDQALPLVTLFSQQLFSQMMWQNKPNTPRPRSTPTSPERPLGPSNNLQ